MGWNDDVHVLPADDSHTADGLCWCQPVIHAEDIATGARVVMHRRYLDGPVYEMDRADDSDVDGGDGSGELGVGLQTSRARVRGDDGEGAGPAAGDPEGLLPEVWSGARTGRALRAFWRRAAEALIAGHPRHLGGDQSDEPIGPPPMEGE